MRNQPSPDLICMSATDESALSLSFSLSLSREQVAIFHREAGTQGMGTPSWKVQALVVVVDCDVSHDCFAS